MTPSVMAPGIKAMSAETNANLVLSEASANTNALAQRRSWMPCAICSMLAMPMKLAATSTRQRRCQPQGNDNRGEGKEGEGKEDRTFSGGSGDVAHARADQVLGAEAEGERGETGHDEEGGETHVGRAGCEVEDGHNSSNAQGKEESVSWRA